MNARAVIAAIAVVALGLVGLRALADATLTTHERTDPDSQTAVVVHGSIVDAAEHDLADGVDGLMRFCQLEVRGAIDPGPIESLGEDEFRVVFTPALDDADERQLRGCVGDIVVDHLQASVVSMTPIDP